MKNSDVRNRENSGQQKPEFPGFRSVLSPDKNA